MKFALALALLALAPGAARADTVVETAQGDWSYLPALEIGDYAHLHTGDLDSLWKIANSKACKLPGYQHGKLDFRLSFAVQYRPDGSLGRVVLPPLNCPAAESLLGRMLTEMIAGGDYRRVPADSDGWYRADFSFAYSA